MPATYDLVLKGGTVVNQDGVAGRDIAVAQGRIAGIGSLSARARRRPSIAAGSISCPASSTARCISASPAPSTRKISKRAAAPPWWAASPAFSRCPIPSRSPHRPRRSPTRSRAPPTACSATSLSISAARARMRQLCPTLERLPGCAGVKVFMGSSTGDLLVDDDDGVATDPCRRLRAAPPSTARTSSACARANPSSAPAMLRAIRSGAMPKPRACAPSGCCVSPAEHGKRIHVLHVSTADEMPLLAANKDLATVEVTPHHLTLRVR